MKCWGLNDHGQLGDGTTTTRSAPTLITGLHNVATLALGESHTCAVLTDGTTFCWGLNSSGQLGDGTTTERTSPVNASWYSNFASLSAGTANTCGRLTDGKIRCWGYNSNLELGVGDTAATSSPASSAVLSVTSASQIASGLSYGCAVITGGTVQCWGADVLGVPTIGLRSTSGFIP